MSDSELFSWIDYLLFSLMLCSSALIGIYFACKKNKVKIEDEYLLGGKTMQVFPVAASLIASNVSGILLMAVPADVYQFGASLFWCNISTIVSVIISLLFYLPVLLQHKYNTIFEYLEIRFNRKIRLLSSIFCVFQMLLLNPIYVFIPTLALAQVTGFPLHAISISVCTICIFYTTIGGLKAVVWTDTLQTFVMYFSFLIIFIKGVYISDGLTNIWNTSFKGDRLDVLRFNLSISDRDSFWSIVIGYAAILLNNIATSQATIQRLMAVPTYSQAKSVMWIFMVGMVISHTSAVIMGLLIYARYSECDPVTTQQILRYDQILPFYVLDIAKSLTGLPGLFIAGVLSASLSSLSTNLNTLSGIIYADFLTPYACIRKKKKNTVLKLLVVISGVLCILSVFLVEQLGGIVPLCASFTAITGGPLLGLFTLGIAVPRANSKSSLTGGIIGVAFVIWITAGNHYYKQNGAIQEIPKTLSATNCSMWTNISPMLFCFCRVTTKVSELPEQPFTLYTITFWYYTIIGCCTTIVVGYITSFFIYDKDNTKIDPELIAPLLHFLLPRRHMKKNEIDFELQTPLKMPLENNLIQ
ncbi:hypothetical protein RN001_009449 [Aquatica leii]|uniref:Sodium-dependent multivitamin transporter n=1 Tax=Aquatica leii TaxID=1421715 RepID=A0AAN7SMX9_9COLE|nr:hypothetical protein RN001_009449 [Aquatica leii]